MASRGHLGGLAGTTAESAAVLDACGFGLVFIETVGTGQSEVEVASIADTTVVVQAPEMGDEIQAMKAGLMEVADLFVVNKADRPGADQLKKEIEVVQVDADRNLLVVKGSVPGHAGGRLIVKPTVKGKG